MKTKELINRLMKADPDGDCEIFMNGHGLVDNSHFCLREKVEYIGKTPSNNRILLGNTIDPKEMKNFLKIKDCSASK